MSLRVEIGLRRGSFRLEVALEVEPGQTLALVGPNGSGKSTLVEALAGLIPIETGEIMLDDEPLERPRDGTRVRPQDRPIGVMFQGLWLFPHMSVQDNASYGLWASGRSRREARAEVLDLLERLDLLALAERLPAALSGGEAQRVALARALAVRPRLLLLDEPFSALDLESRPRTRGFLQEVLAEFEGPRLVITHDALEALLLADRVVVLENGRVAQSGSTDEVRRQPRTRYVATLAGVNLLSGTLREERGEWLLQTPELSLAAGARDLPAGASVHGTIHPGAVRLVRSEVATATANSWATAVQSIQLEGDRVRIVLESPPGFCAELPSAELDLRQYAPGTPVRASVGPKDIYIYPRSLPRG